MVVQCHNLAIHTNTGRQIMSTFAVTNSDQVLPAVNYLLANLDTLPGNVLVANTSTGVVSQTGNSTPFAYLYQYVNVRYSNNATGTAGFDTNSNNYSYFGVYNSTTSTASTNPSAYQWFEVSPPFNSATSRTLYYASIGGRQIQWVAANALPASNFVVTSPGVAIDLDIVTGTTGTDGFSIVVPNVYQRALTTPATPTGGSYDFDTTTLTPPVGWSADPPAGTNPLYVSQNTFESNAGGSVAPVGPWTTPVILVENGANGTPGTDGVSVYLYPVFRQSATQPATPGADGSFNFGTQTGTPPAGWSNAPVSTTTDPIWVITARATSPTPTGVWTATVSSWSTPVQYSGSGGVDGERGFIPMAYVVTTQNPTITPGNTQANLTTAFSALRTNTVAPIGTGYSPIPGDTASFTWSSNTAVNQVYTYNSSNVWVSATGQVVNGNVIVTGSINANSLNANDVYALNLRGGNVTVGTYSGTGYWFQASSGNAYIAGNLQIGNNATIGNNLTIANSANIGNNLTIGNLLTVGTSANIGNLLTVGANANIGGNLRVGNNANIGNSLTIGNLLTVGSNANIGGNLVIGNNANIGGNLFVSGLITSGNLNANTVNTTTVVPSAISAGAQSIVIAQEIFAQNAVANTLYLGNCIAQLQTTLNNQSVYVFAGLNNNLVIQTTGNVTIEREVILTRFNYSSNTFSELNSFTIGPINFPTAGAYAAGAFLAPFVGYYDVLPTAGNYAYTVGQAYSVQSGAGNIANVIIVGNDATVVVQNIKR